jgi:hypothetical protein
MAPLPSPLPTKAARRTMHTVPKAKPKVAPDGKSYTTPHFILMYADGVSADERFDTPDERDSFGLGKLLQIEALYEFLEEVFGFTLETQALVVVDPELKAIYGARPAGYVDPSDAEYGGRTVVHLSVDTISDRAILTHELTHALDMLCVGASAPAWFAEGLAQMVENELVDANDARYPTPIGFDADGRNLLQLWSGHRRSGAGLPPAVRQNAYNHAYYILATLRDTHGDIFYRRLFDLMRDHNRVSDAQLVGLMSEAAGVDLEPFFVGELKFELAKQQAVDGFAPYVAGLGLVTDGDASIWGFHDGGSVERRRQGADDGEWVIDVGSYGLRADASDPSVFHANITFRRRVRMVYDEAARQWVQRDETTQNLAATVVLGRAANGVRIDGVLHRPAK